MAKLIVNAFVTMDGYFDSTEGNLEAVFAHRWSGYTSIDDFDLYNLALLEACGTLVLGRKTFQGNRAYWKDINEGSAESGVRKKLADRFRAIEKVVVGSTSDGVEFEGWGPMRFVSRAEAVERLREAKQTAKRDLLVMMSRLLWNELLRHTLVDELHLTVFPMALGTGRPLFVEQPTCAFRLKESRSYPASGNVLNVYEVIYE